MKKYIIMMCALCGSMFAHAEGDSFEGTVSTDIVSQYIWRGQDCGSMAIQPTLGIGWKGLSLTGWGSVGIVDPSDTKELDLTLAYETSGFNVGITDYWFSVGGNAAAKYFAYKAHSTNHIFEANVGYDFGFLSLQWYTNFLGNDYKANGKRAYSSYFEVAAPFRFVKLDWDAAVGISPYASAVYGNGKFACTNVSLKATKTFKIKDKLEIPLYAQLAANPNSGKLYFVAGVAFTPNL